MKQVSRMLVLLMAHVAAAGSLLAEAIVPDGGLKPPFDEIGFEQRLGERVPREPAFKDEEGRDVKMSDFLGARPVILSFAYYRCPMLCPLVQTGLGKSMAVLSLKPGVDFTALTVSIDPTDTPAMALAAKKKFLKETGLTEAAAGWHFLTGGQGSIDALTTAAGFRYAHDKATGQYAHTGGLVVITPDGRLGQYLLGIDFAPRDLKLALVEAGGGRVGTVVDRLTLLCYQYDPAKGGYGLAVYRIVRTGGVLTVALTAVFVFGMLRRERKASRERTA